MTGAIQAKYTIVEPSYEATEGDLEDIQACLDCKMSNFCKLREKREKREKLNWIEFPDTILLLQACPYQQSIDDE